MDPYGHSVRDLARLAGVTERSVRRWKVAGRVPEPYSTRVSLLLTADLGALSEAWGGWSIQRGELVSPEGLRLLPQHLRALPLHLEALHAHRQARQRFAHQRHTAAELTNAAAQLLVSFAAARKAMSAAEHLLRQTNGKKTAVSLVPPARSAIEVHAR
jgi:Phage protein